MLLGIILFPLSMGFSLIYRMWVSQLYITDIWAKRTGSSLWAGSQGLRCIIWRDSSLGLASGPASPFFKPHQLPPSPCARCTRARAITFLVSSVISMCQLGAGSVRALSSSYVL